MRTLNNARKLRHLLHFWTSRFQKLHIPDPGSSAEYLIAHAVQRKTLHNIDLCKELTKSQVELVEKLCKLRLSRMPVQYIIGEWDFLDLTLKMKPPVLIPRPETEELASLCMETLRKLPSTEDKVFLEIGSGTGAISLSLLKKFAQLRAVAVDISKTACDLTRHNADLTDTSERLTVIEGDIKDQRVLDQVDRLGPFSLVVSNPPYISTPEMRDLQPEIACFEDHQALHGGVDGSDLVKQIMWSSAQSLNKHGHMWLEVGDKHPPLIKELCEDRNFWSGKDRRLQYVETVADLYGKDRFCYMIASS